MLTAAPSTEFVVRLLHEQRERLSNGEWTDWHPMNMLDMQEGLIVGQRFQRRINGRTTGVMIFHDTPGVKFQIDSETVAP